jgi:hypothetical protein
MVVLALLRLFPEVQLHTQAVAAAVFITERTSELVAQAVAVTDLLLEPQELQI